MEKTFNYLSIQKTRLYFLCNLVFFVIILSSCDGSKIYDKVSIVKEDDRAVAVSIPSHLLQGLQNDDIENNLHVRMANTTENMLGEYETDNSRIVFKPLIELSPGATYYIIFKGNIISELTIPERELITKTTLDAIFPESDSLPENLLKIYLKFSKPMRQGVSEKYLSIIDSKGDTLHNVFLNLNTELWDEEGKQLTIWLNPGRIKRGLQPNENEGSPLKSGNSYTFSVSGEWTDIKGNKLAKSYSKGFITGPKDIISPNMTLWTINLPAAGSGQALKVDFNESLDHSLIPNTIIVIRRDGELIEGKILPKEGEKSFLFYPDKPWTSGNYYLKTDSRLEDLAGNNLNRLFDNDIIKDKPPRISEFYSKRFYID